KKILETITEKPIYVVPNGVDTEKFRPDIASGNNIRRSLGLSSEDVIVTFVGSFREWHGVHQIPAIASEIGKKYKTVKFILIGSGHLYDLVNRTRSGNMLILGSKEYNEIPGYLAISDILIAPFDASRFKYIDKYGFWWNPVKIFEYLSSGKPVVTYDYPEIVNIVKDAGMLAAAGDINDFTTKLEYLIQEEKVRHELGKKARELAIKEYSWNIRAKQTTDIYKEVLKKYR
ncbi:MAG TPA: glycosyltransferase family 4 protein, partial [Candidatus Methanoperedens sp.]